MAERVYLNVCPDCGCTDSGHALDPPAQCPHDYGRYVPVEFVEAALLDAERQRARDVANELRHIIASDWPLHEPRKAAGLIREQADCLTEGDEDAD